MWDNAIKNYAKDLEKDIRDGKISNKIVINACNDEKSMTEYEAKMLEKYLLELVPTASVTYIN